MHTSNYHPLVLAQTATATGNSGVISGSWNKLRGATFYLRMTNAHSTAADTLDVTIQHGLDAPLSGTTKPATIWSTFVQFTQVLGNGSDTVTRIAKWVATADPGTTNDELASTGIAAAGVLQGPITDKLRVVWTITDNSGAATFTFDVFAAIQEE